MDDPQQLDLNMDIQFSDDEDAEEANETNIWKIKYDEEQKFWLFLLNNGYIYNPSTCPVCDIGELQIKKYKLENILKIFYCRCNNKKCSKTIDIRKFSIFNLAKNLPASLIFKIIEYFFLMN